MAILKIARMGHPVLRGVAAPVADPTAPEMRRLVADMMETAPDAFGTGLAAPQVHAPWRVVVFMVGPERLTGRPLDTAQDWLTLINPAIEPLGDETELGWEGCLSVPGLRGAVPRWSRIRYRGIDAEGRPIERVAEGFHARVVQHECDHLDGILYPQRMPDLRLLQFNEEAMRFPISLPGAAPAPENLGPGKSGLTEEDREALLLALLPDVPFDGWSRAALLSAARRAGIGADAAAALFPSGARDLVAEFSRWSDRQMLARLDRLDLTGFKTHERVAVAMMARFEGLALYREAARRALTVLAQPTNAPLAGRLLYETVDAIWYAVGDRSVDFSFYTKRATLAGIQAVTTLYWLEDRSANFVETRGFLERRLAEIGALPRLRQRVTAWLDRLPHPTGLTRAMRGK